MRTNISKDQILKLARLSKILIEEKNLDKITKDMQNIVNLADQISKADILSEKLLSPIKNKIKGHLRADVPCESFSQVEILSGAIDTKDNFLVVKNFSKE